MASGKPTSGHQPCWFNARVVQITIEEEEEKIASRPLIIIVEEHKKTSISAET